MDEKLRRNPPCVYVINYHLVWTPRYRKKVLVGPITERLKNLFNEIAV
jgi:putative transposase